MVPADGTQNVPGGYNRCYQLGHTSIKVKSIPAICAIKPAIPCIMAVPSMLIVVPTGTTKDATSLSTPIS